MNDSSYGLSEYYQGEKGKDYFARQNQGSNDFGGQLNCRKFSKFIKPEHKVLDFGCGGGWLLKNLNASQKVGVEPNSAAHETCKLNGIEVFSSMSKVPYQDFDRIISHHCLEHVPYPTQALCEMHEKLSDDGVLVIVLPIDDWRTQRDFTGRDNDHHLHTWTPRLAANTLWDANFETTDVKVLTHAWPPKYRTLHKLLPSFLFDLACSAFAVIAKRRQLMIIAKKRTSTNAEVN